MSFLEVNNLKKIYTTRFGGAKVQALSDVSFTAEQGEFVAIMGESGSGKTTLLNILASLDKPTSGDVVLDGMRLSEIKERDAATFRRDNLGFVFQDFNLLDNFSIQDNIFLPLVLSGKKYDEMNARLKPLSAELGISELLQKYPYEVSGGQKQRTAVARALITEPKLVLADEPTGALDSKSSEELLDIFEKINRRGQTVLMVTHSVKAASRAGRVLFIKDGQVFHQIYRGQSTGDEMFLKISDAVAVMSTGAQMSQIQAQQPHGQQVYAQQTREQYAQMMLGQTQSVQAKIESQENMATRAQSAAKAVMSAEDRAIHSRYSEGGENHG